MSPPKDDFVRLWTSAQSGVAAYISAMVPNYHDAEDILQECASVLLQKFAQYDGSRPFLSWAIGVARTEIFSRRRRFQVERLVFDEPAMESLAEVYQELGAAVDERVEALRFCAGKAQGRARELLNMRYGENLKPREIAKRIGSNPNATTVALTRIREALRKCMEKWLKREERGGTDLVSLTSAFIDERLAPDEARWLRKAVMADSESAKCVTLELVFHRQLYDIFHGERALRLEESPAELSEDWRHSAVVLPAITEVARKEDFEAPVPVIRSPIAGPRMQRSPVAAHWKKAAAAVLLAITVAAAIVLHRSPTVAPVAIAPAFVATWGQMVYATWDNGSAAPAVVRAGNQLSLKSGFCSLRFGDGTQVIVEGPAHFTAQSGNQIVLQDGKLTAAMTGGAKGFVVQTPSSIIADLGTEFGVSVDPSNGKTRVDVFRGSVRVTPTGRQPPTASADLAAGDSATVENNALRVERGGSVPQRFVRNISGGPLALDVADLLAGGDGTTHRRGGTVDPATGRTGPMPLTTDIDSDSQYHRISTMPVLDGCFIPKGGLKAVQVDSAGDRCAVGKTDGKTYDRIFSGNFIPVPADGWPISPVLNGVDYSQPDHWFLYLHANVGLTFDLAALRSLHPGSALEQFHAKIGNVFSRGAAVAGPSMVFFIVDGKVRSQLRVRGPAVLSGEVPLSDSDRFLTIVVTDAGTGRQSKDILLGDAAFEMGARR